MVVDGDWRMIREEVRAGPMNMALDEIAARTVTEGGLPTVRVYSWSPSTMSLGYNQPRETVDWRFCERENVAVTRRPTGGGGIYHDRIGDISYSIVAPAADLPGKLLEAYRVLLEPILDAFDRLGVDVMFAEASRPAVYEPACYLRDLHPAHDLVVDGRKISGNAQYRQRDAVIQHGSLTYARESARHLAVFADPPSVETFESRVTSIREQSGGGRQRAVASLEAALEEWSDAEPDEWTAQEIDAARTLAREKYDDEEWIRGRPSVESG